MLTGKHVLEALAALQAAKSLPYSPTTDQICQLRIRATLAEMNLRIFSGLEEVKVPVEVEQ